MKYTHIFFDLDRTLWDFEANSKIVLENIFQNLNLKQYFISFSEFYEIFLEINKNLWNKYYDRQIDKTTLSYLRFYETLLIGGLDNIKLAKKIGADYIELSPIQKKLFPNTHEILTYLKNKGYDLNILTNGFNEVQFKKTEICGLSPYFSQIITSENAGFHKPDKRIFLYALKLINADIRKSVMIGDDLITDISGAQNIGMDTIYFNFSEKNSITIKPKLEIRELIELKNIL